MDKILDLRIIKTRRALTDALFNLLKFNNNVKVLNICQKAKITPMTFYHQFKNKTELLEYSLKNALENKLPIPKMLKPKNLKQLIWYLINIFSDFFNQNKQIILNNLKFTKNNGYKNTYLDILIKICHYYISSEIKLIIQKTDIITFNNLVDFITYGLLSIFINRVKTNMEINNTALINSFKLSLTMFL